MDSSTPQDSQGTPDPAAPGDATSGAAAERRNGGRPAGEAYVPERFAFDQQARPPAATDAQQWPAETTAWPQLAPPAAAGAPMPVQMPSPMPPAPSLAPTALLTPPAAPGGGEAEAAGPAFDLVGVLVHMVDIGGSDLHLSVNAPPMVRVHGNLQPVPDVAVLTPTAIRQAIYAILTQKQRERFEADLELDLAFALPSTARFRVNVYRQRDSVGAVFRFIPHEIRTLESLGIPGSVSAFADLPRGMVLVTGPTGSGKSTTLAALVDLANRTREDHIMTVEDPIEFLHKHKKCLVHQREVGEDTRSFANALRHVLRQDPDIILIGELRDLETISVALTAAETGHLVFATLHTQDAAQTVDRLIDVFPPYQQQQVRVQLAGTLQGIVCQTLCRTHDGRGRAVATEVLTATPAVRNLIREGKTHQIYSVLQSGAQHGMHTMDQHLADLVRSGRVGYDQALEKCHHVEEFRRLCGKG